MQHPISTFDVGWQPEILSPIARLPAGLYSFNGCTTVYCRLKICAHFRGLVLEYFLTKNCLELSIFEVNEQEKNNRRQKFRFTNPLRNRPHKVRTLRMRDVSRAYTREHSVHRARRRALSAYYVNLLFMNWYVSVERIVKKIL